jgi:hypothetical protein
MRSNDQRHKHTKQAKRKTGQQQHQKEQRTSQHYGDKD